MSEETQSDRAALAPGFDPIQFEIVEGMEKYVEGKLMTDQHKRECMAAYLSGMQHGMNMLKVKRPFILLPAVLHQKIMTFAKLLGLQFEKAGPTSAPVSGKTRPSEL